MSKKVILEGHPEIARLAIVGKDFSTYYIPNITNVGGTIIKMIRESAEDFTCYGEDGIMVARITKDCPYLVDYYPFQAAEPESLKKED